MITPLVFIHNWIENLRNSISLECRVIFQPVGYTPLDLIQDIQIKKDSIILELEKDIQYNFRPPKNKQVHTYQLDIQSENKSLFISLTAKNYEKKIFNNENVIILSNIEILQVDELKTIISFENQFLSNKNGRFN